MKNGTKNCIKAFGISFVRNKFTESITKKILEVRMNQ